MTALSNLIAKLDCEEPELAKMFTPEYSKYLLANIRDNVLESVKELVDHYIKEALQDDIINYKLYSYKTLRNHTEGLTVEILIQPENTSTIIQYLLGITLEKSTLRRLR